MQTNKLISYHCLPHPPFLGFMHMLFGGALFLSLIIFSPLLCCANGVVISMHKYNMEQTAFVPASFLLLRVCIFFFGRTQLNILWQIIHFRPTLFSESNKYSSSISLPHCGKRNKDRKGKYSVLHVRYLWLTDNLFMREAHDAHGI